MSAAVQDTRPVAVVIYTHDRVDDAKGNIELIRKRWIKSSYLSNAHIVHAYNGKHAWYPHKTGEDVLVRVPNPEPRDTGLKHFLGADALIEGGRVAALESCPEAKWVIVLASDSWLLKPETLTSILQNMDRRRQTLASIPWFSEREVFTPRAWGLGIDCLIYHQPWAATHGLFPLEYEKDLRIPMYDSRGEKTTPLLEQSLERKFRQAVAHEFGVGIDDVEPFLMDRFYNLPRMGVLRPLGTFLRDWNSDALGLTTAHHPRIRIEFLLRHGFCAETTADLPHMHRLLTSQAPAETWNLTDHVPAPEIT